VLTAQTNAVALDILENGIDPNRTSLRGPATDERPA
jgi:hypothetical protein